MLDLGGAEQSIAKQAMRAGAPLPERIANAPKLIDGLQMYMDAFFDLDSERTHSFSLMAIPWTSIRSYAQACKFDDEQTEDLHFLIKRMDEAHLKRLSRKQKK